MDATKINILLVDDSPDGLVAMEAALADLGQNCVKAGSGKAALRWLLDHECAVILLDVRMPDMDGFETAALIREREKSRGTPIIFITGVSDEETHLSQAYSLGAVDYLFKPVAPQIVRSKVEALVGLFNEKRELERESEKLAQERSELAQFVEAIRSGQVDTITGTEGGKSKILHLLDAKVVEENNRLIQDLSRSNAKLEEASHVKDEFLAKMSHELRTPLNSIIGFTEMMIDDPKDPPNEKRAKRLEKVHRNSKNLLALINDILDISKIESGRLVLDHEYVDVACLITECVESVQPLVKSDQVELRQHIDESIRRGAQWEGDGVRLQQIVTNLLGNAAKFTESGHIEIRAAKDSESLLIEIEDTGIGLPTEHLAIIFDEFKQVDSSSTRRAGGTGLGLSICRKLCKLMGGQISVTSTPEVGSCFAVRLPIAVSPTVQQDDLEQTREGNPLILYAGLGLSSQRIEQAVGTIIPEIECATEAEQAVSLCRRQSPSVAWIDPFWTDALRLLADLKTHRGTASIPIGLLGLVDDRGAFMAFDDCITSPLGKDTLHRVARAGCSATMSTVLSFLTSAAENQYVRDMLAEFPDVEVIEATSVSHALDLISATHFDVVIFALLDPSAERLELAHHLGQCSTNAIPRLIAVIPREPTPENGVVLRKAFQSYTAKRGEPIDHVLARLVAPVTNLRNSNLEKAIVT